MNFVKASQKITNCIDTAVTKEHFIAIDKMIETCTTYAKKQKSWDKTILGAFSLLYWQNVNKYEKTFGKLK